MTKTTKSDKDVIKSVIDRVDVLIAVANEGEMETVLKALKNEPGRVLKCPSCDQEIPACAACEAYQKDVSEAPYTMYQVKGGPKYYLDCINCPVGVTLGECSADNSTWRRAYDAVKDDKKALFIKVAENAKRKLKVLLLH